MSVTLRPFRPEDATTICALANRARRADRIPQVFVEDELTDMLGSLDVENDVRVAELDGQIAGWTVAWFSPSGALLERAILMGEVDPDLRRRGVGRALVDWSVARATELLRTAPSDLRHVIRVDAYEQCVDAQHLFTRAGFVPVRWFEELLRPLTPVPTVEVADGYDVVDWPEGRDEELCALRNAAFADHWGSAAWSAERFHEATTGFGARLDLSVVAIERASGKIVASCLNEHYPQDEALLGRRDGWIAVLGTDAAHRGRGLASALIGASMHRFAAAGLTHASIGVDSASPTGAHRLYRALGFAPAHRHLAFEVEVDASVGPECVSDRPE